MEELVDVLARLADAGYRGSFRADDGRLRCGSCGRTAGTADVVIERVVRLEGTSDPSEEVAIFAMECLLCGVKGTYVVPYGPAMDAEDAAIVARLRDGRSKGGTPRSM